MSPRLAPDRSPLCARSDTGSVGSTASVFTTSVFSATGSGAVESFSASSRSRCCVSASCRLSSSSSDLRPSSDDDDDDVEAPAVAELEKKTEDHIVCVEFVTA